MTVNSKMVVVVGTDHLTVPCEQKTQQSPGNGLSRLRTGDTLIEEQAGIRWHVFFLLKATLRTSN